MEPVITQSIVTCKVGTRRASLALPRSKSQSSQTAPREEGPALCEGMQQGIKRRAAITLCVSVSAPLLQTTQHDIRLNKITQSDRRGQKAIPEWHLRFKGFLTRQPYVHTCIMLAPNCSQTGMHRSRLSLIEDT